MQTFPPIDPVVQAERNRMAVEREAKVAAMRAAEAEEFVLPVLRLTDQLDSIVAADRVPDLIRALRDAKPSMLDRALTQLGNRHEQRKRENLRLREAEDYAAHLRAQAST